MSSRWREIIFQQVSIGAAPGIRASLVHWEPMSTIVGAVLVVFGASLYSTIVEGLASPLVDRLTEMQR